jgi:hypothetical protein
LAISAGSVAVRVVPSAATFAKDLQAQILPKVTTIGVEIGKAISEGISRGLGDPLSGPLDESSKKQRTKAPRQGEEVAGAFAKGFQDRLRAAFASLPKATIDADSSAADRKIAELRARMEELSGKTIGVDLDEGEALTQIAAIKAELADLGRSESVQVRADTGAAAAQLAAIEAEVDRLDGRTANFRVSADTSSAISGIGTLAISIGALASIPVGATLGAGLLSLIGPIGAAGAGFGGLAAVAVPAISHVKDALDAQKQATAASAAGAVQAQSRALAEAGAQQQLAAAVRNSAFAHQQALAQVTTAQQQLTVAEQSAANAERALTAARQQAQRQLQDMSNQVTDAQLSVRSSTFDVADAQRAYNQVVSNPRATQDQIARSKLALDQSRQTLKEQQLDLKRLQADQKAADTAGVDGSNAVRSARQSLASANQQVVSSERALAAARANVARADQNSADQVAAARRAVTQASLQGASANGKLAASMAALSPSERGLLRDWKSLTGAFRNWSKSLQPAVLPVFGRGLKLVQGILPSLTPLVRGAAGAVDGLITDVGVAAKSPFWVQFRNNLTNLVPGAITGLGKSTGNVVTGLAGIVNAFLPYAPAILSWLTRITGEFANWGKSLGTSNSFTKFVQYVQKAGPQLGQTLAQLGKALVNIVSSLSGFGLASLVGIRGLASIVAGMSPTEIQAIATAFIAVKGAIALNSTATSSAKAIQGMNDAVRSGGKEGPILARGATLAGKGIAGLAVVVWSAVTALGALALAHTRTAVAATANAAETVAVTVATNVARVATAVWAGVQWLLDAALNANPIGLVVLALAALTAGVIYAYTHFNWFRSIVQSTWAGIQVATSFAWNNILKPIFGALSWAIMNTIVPQLRNMWTVSSLVWSGIASACRVGWSILKGIFSAIRASVQFTGVVFGVFQGIVSTVIKAAGRVIMAVWRGDISGAFSALKSGIGKVGDAFRSGASAIKSAWDKIKGYTKTPINFVIGTVYNKGIVGLWNKVMGWLHLPKSLQLGTVPLLASGGELSAAQRVSPMKTNRPTAIVGEGNPRFPEYVIPTDPKYRGRASALWASAGSDMQMLAGGGILGSVIKTVEGAAGKVVSLGKTAMDLITNPTKVFSKLAAPILSQAKGLGTSPWGQAAAAIPSKLMEQVSSAAKQLVDAFNKGYGGGAGAQGIINAARGEIGNGEQPPGSNNTKYGKWFGINPAPWCAMFVDYVANKAGVGKLIPHTASAPGMASAFGGRYHSGGRGIQPGDVPFFSNGGGISHVGLVEKVNGGSVGTIEGNHTSFVQRVARSIGQIVGYGRPNYPAGGNGAGGTAPAGGKTPSSAQAFARGQLGEFHWSGSQFSPLLNLWNRESGWRWNARNPSSGAYGIPQSLPGSKMASAGSDWRTNGDTQVLWGLGYIKQRYGSPAGAWAHSQHTGWYDQGGWLPTGPSLVYNGTGRPEPVFTGNQFDDLVAGRSGGGTREYHAHFDGLTGAAIEGHVRGAFHAMEVSSGNRERVGRRH